jgi:WD40 repeat protein
VTLFRLLPLILLPAVASGADKVTFDAHVLPVFEQSCLNCHNPDKAKGGLDLSTYEGTLKGGSGGKIVEPGDASSKLLAVVLRTAEPAMPPEGDAIPAKQADTLRQWIEGGLLRNADSQARKPSKPKFDTALRGGPGTTSDGPPPMPLDLLLEPAVVATRPSAIQAMAISPRAPLLAVGAPFQILLHDARSFELAGVLPFPEGEPVSLAFTPDGRYLVAGGGRAGKSGLTVTFDVTNGERVLTAGREFDTILCADLRPDLGAVATGSPSRLIKLWNAADGSQAASIKKHTDWVTALDYSPDGILLASGDRNGGVWVREALTGAEFHTLRAHQAGVTVTAFRSDSNLLATASEDGTVRLWEMNGGQEVRKLDAHPGGVLAFAWGPDGGFATAGRDRKALLWKSDFSPGRTIDQLPEMPTAIALDGSHVFVADYQGQVRVYRADDGAPVAGFDNNPPTIAQRLESIAEALATLADGSDEKTRRLKELRHWERARLNLRATELEREAKRLRDLYHASGEDED